jgi:hypothetical protein
MAEDGAMRLRVVEGSGSGSGDVVGEYLSTLGGRSAATADAYGRILRQLARRVGRREAGRRLKERWDGWEREPFSGRGNVVSVCGR